MREGNAWSTLLEDKIDLFVEIFWLKYFMKGAYENVLSGHMWTEKAQISLYIHGPWFESH